MKTASIPEPRTPTGKKAVGLSGSKYAKTDDEDDEVESSTAEGEHDSSSAALASVGKPLPNA